MGHAIDRMRGRQQRCRAQPRAFDGVGTEMLVEPGSPDRSDAVAGLQQRPHPRTGPAAHQAEMPAMLARQQFDDGGGFAMPPYAQHNAFVGPFHEGSLQDLGEERSGLADVIPGRCAASNPESRDSGFASSMRPGMTVLVTTR